jgi:hypothetical protein
MQSRAQDERITRYLLGRLTEDEQTAVEEEYFADPEKFEAVWAAENDLVDAYVRGRLPRDERKLFERHYLQSPKHRERIAVAGKLLEAANRLAAEGAIATQVVEPTSSWWSRIRETLNSARALRIGLVVATILLLSVGLTWLLLERARLNSELGRAQARLSEQQRLELETASQLAAERKQNDKLKSELNRLQETISKDSSQPSDQIERPSILSFFLSPTLVRSGSEPQQIAITGGTEMVRLRMMIEKGDLRKFQAVVRTVEGTQIMNQRSLIPRSNTIAVNIPANKLPLGDYILTLSAITPPGETEEINRYFFRIHRK